MSESFLEQFKSREKRDVSGFDKDYDLIEEIGSVEAIWSQFVNICGKSYWKMDQIFPHKVIDCERKLPSDSIFR